MIVSATWVLKSSNDIIILRDTWKLPSCVSHDDCEVGDPKSASAGAKSSMQAAGRRRERDDQGTSGKVKCALGARALSTWTIGFALKNVHVHISM
jgi:hypothetical protein